MNLMTAQRILISIMMTIIPPMRISESIFPQDFILQVQVTDVVTMSAIELLAAGLWP